MNVLINAYAVSPNHGSEPGMGWNWTTNIARYCKVHVITEGEWQHEIEETIKKLSYANNFRFYFIPVTAEIRKICWDQGDWRFYYYYHQWQKRALVKAKEICKSENIDLMHQLNMIGYREPGLLWKIEEIPIIWGPVGGFGGIPINFLSAFGFKGAFKQILKNIINQVQVFQPNVFQAIKRSDLILTANSESKKSLQKLGNGKVYLLNETGAGEIVKQQRNFQSDILKLVWVGKLDNRKALPLALNAMKQLADLPIELHVIGVQKEKVDASLFSGLTNVHFYSWMSHAEVQNFLKQSHIFIFTSLNEGTPHVVIEALTKGLPVICHDICGQGDSVTKESGIKIPLKNPKYSIEAFAQAILKLYHNRTLLEQLSNGAYERAQEITWENKTRILLDHYEKLTGKSISS